MKKRIWWLVIAILAICLTPVVSKCKCGGTTIQSLTYNIEYGYGANEVFDCSVEILGITVYKAGDFAD